MKTGTIVAMAITAIVVLGVSVAAGIAGWMMWALALNGFMGQQRAVETSMVVYLVLAVISGLISTVLSLLTFYFLAGRREWNAALSALLSIPIFAVTTGVLHTVSVVISAIVAEQLRTTR
jgi:hypothetical protein